MFIRWSFWWSEGHKMVIRWSFWRFMKPCLLGPCIINPVQRQIVFGHAYFPPGQIIHNTSKKVITLFFFSTNTFNTHHREQNHTRQQIWENRRNTHLHYHDQPLPEEEHILKSWLGIRDSLWNWYVCQWKTYGNMFLFRNSEEKKKAIIHAATKITKIFVCRRENQLLQDSVWGFRCQQSDFRNSSQRFRPVNFHQLLWISHVQIGMQVLVCRERPVHTGQHHSRGVQVTKNLCSCRDVNRGGHSGFFS